MKGGYLVLLAMLFFACQKNNDVAPSSTNNNEVEETNGEIQKNDPDNKELSEPVEVTYFLKSRGSNIVDAKYDVMGEAYTNCGDNKLQFTFETRKLQALELIGTIKNQPGNQIEARIKVNGRVVAQEILEGDKSNRVYSQVEIGHQLQKGQSHGK